MLYRVSAKSLLSIRNSILINAIPYWKNKVLKNHLLFRHGLAEIIWGISHMTLRAYQIHV